MARHKKKKSCTLDYHEGLSDNQVRIILQEMNLEYKPFCEWMIGQTGPMVPRYDKKGGIDMMCGTYEYDVFRYINWKLFGTPTLFD